MSEHSPLPWRLAVTGYDSAGKFFFRVLDDNEPIPPELTLTAIDANGKALEEDFFVGDNWPHIVKCVNLHDELVDFIAHATNRMYDIDSDYGGSVIDRGEALLAKAKGEA